MKYLLRLCTVLLGTIQLINASKADDAEAPAFTAVSVPLNTIHKRRGAERYGRAMAADRPYTPMATPVVASDVPLWGQCGGKGHAGPIACADTSAQCVAVNEWYHQCRPGPTKPPLPPPPTPPTTTRPTPPPSCGPTLACTCLPGFTVTTTSYSGNCSRCGCAPSTSISSPYTTYPPTTCPYPSRCTCPPGYTLTSTSTGTACPWCSCSFTGSSTPTSTPTPITITSTPCPTYSCGGCSSGYYPTMTLSGSATCSQCACLPFSTSNTVSTTECPHPPRCTCPPGYTLTSTSTGTACPWCSCSFTGSATITKPPEVTTTTSTYRDCTTYSCLPCSSGSYITLTTIGTNCPSCACAPYSTSPTTTCPRPPRCTCPPGYTLTSTSTGTACPWCSCSFTGTSTVTKPPAADAMTTSFKDCVTYSCPGCSSGSYITLTTIGTNCPTCTCAPYTFTTSAWPPIITTTTKN